jgi:Ca2+-binding RTX toxin-like protein
VVDKSREYSFKSQYLVNIILTGENNSNIIGNDQDNRLTGNDGNNIITGGKGNDVIAGGKGEDTAKFSSNYSEYKITKVENKTIVTDTVPGRDGKDELMDIEVLKFKDKKVNI